MKDKKTILLYALFGVVAAVTIGLGIYYYVGNSDPIIMEDFAGKTVAEVEIWADDNDITIGYDYAYDETIANGSIISQDITAETTLKKGDTLNIVVSMGPDPDLEITLPDFTGYTYDQIAAFVDENKLTDVTYDYVVDADIPVDVFISHNIETATMKRSDMIVFTMSLGAEEDTTEITVPDFSTYTKTQINNWGTANSVYIKYVTTTSTTVEEGGFIKQSPAAGSITYAKRTITITYSSGTPITAIDLSGKTKSQVISWLDSYDNRISAKYYTSYNNSVEKNVVISNDPNSGYIADGATMKVYLSLGKPSLADYTNETYSSLQSAVESLNTDGANLTLSASTAYSESVAKGLVISQDKSGTISTGTTITVVYSKGKQITVSDFTGKTLSEFSTFITNNNLIKSKSGEQYSDTIAANSLADQDPKSGTVDEGSTITYVLSLGAYTPESFVGKTYTYALSTIDAANAKSAGWTLTKVSEDYNNDYASGVIYEQSISGKTINVKVSKGKSTTVLNYVGTNKDAVSPIDGLTITKTASGYDDSKTAGEIISQSVAAGTVLGLPNSIELFYSLGPSAKANLTNLELYDSDGKSSDTVLSEVKALLTRAGFTDLSNVVKLHCTTEEKTSGDIWDQSKPGEYDADYPIFVYIEP